MKTKIRAISYDFWNTLFCDIHEATYREKRLKLFLETLRLYRECHERQVIAALMHSFKVGHRIWSEEYRSLTVREQLKLVLAHMEMELPDEAIERLTRQSDEIFYEYPPVIIEGVAEVLAVLTSRYKLAIISDTGFTSGLVLRELMRRNGIHDHFSMLTFSDEAGRSKPHQSVFLRTAEGLGVLPEEMLHIGDQELTDVAGAKAVGAHAALFASNLADTQKSAADFIIGSHAELLRILNYEGNE
jgi:FMN hydrolase / 5-amino-6-(5-phospho-D-ribitylamino)uracil phosphatase